MLKQSLQQKMLQKLSPQQIQLMKLLQVPTVELEQRIKEEIEENPALEEGAEEGDDELDDQSEENEETELEERDDMDLSDYFDDETPQYKLSAQNKGADDDEKTVPYASGSSFQDILREQLDLRDLSERERELAYNLVGNLDDDGYLRRDLINIVDDLAFSQNIMTDQQELDRVLTIVQALDPPGVGARNLRECLLIQLERKNNNDPEAELALEIVRDHFEAFTRKHYSKITQKLEIDDEDLKDAVEEIVKLNPKPGNSMRDSAKSAQQIVPDFYVTVEEGELQLTLHGRNAPELRVSQSYQEMLKGYAAAEKKNKEQKEAVMFVKKKIDSAKWFIDAIKQRQHTLLSTMQAILEFQRDYFITGDETRLRPMILKDIADRVNLDISTISRVANSKYVQTPYGTFLLKSLFSESISTESGEEVSTREVKKILQDNVEAENKRKPLTDEKLAQNLREKGYNIARRTVAKYREQLNIPVARLRKEL